MGRLSGPGVVMLAASTGARVHALGCVAATALKPDHSAPTRASQASRDSPDRAHSAFSNSGKPWIGRLRPCACSSSLLPTASSEA